MSESKSESCLVATLSRYTNLSATDEQTLRALEESEVSFHAGDEVFSTSQPVNNLYVVKSGWLLSYTPQRDGHRQIVDIHLPGDILGFPDIVLPHHILTASCATDAVLCPLKKNGLSSMIHSSPKLTALMFALAMRDQVWLIDILRTNSTMTAPNRVGFLLLDLLARQATNSGSTDELDLPLTQGQIAAILGLTNVSVSRAFRILEKRRLIERKGQRVRILCRNDLSDSAQFVDRYQALDTSWMIQQMN